MSDKEISQEREYSIVKANDLIQKTTFDLTLQEQKIVLYLISKIKPEDKELREQEFEIANFCKVCGIEYRSGGNYKIIKDTLQKLYDKSCWIKIDKELILFSWLSFVKIKEGNGTIEIQLHKFLEPYLLSLKERFTKYSLYFTLPMKSQYSIRMYELFKSYEYKKSIYFKIDDLKEILKATNYKQHNDFKRKVLEIALNEINKFSDIEVSYSLEKKSRKFVGITFFIKLRKNIDERLKVFANIEKVINKDYENSYLKKLNY